MKNNLVAYLTAVLTAICCSACATAGDGQFKIIEKELGNRISLSINEPSCRVSVEFDEKSVNKRKREVIFVRNDCLGNEAGEKAAQCPRKSLSNADYLP